MFELKKDIAMALLGGTFGRGALLALCSRASPNGVTLLARTTTNKPGMNELNALIRHQ